MSSLYELAGQYLEALDFLTDPVNEVDKQTIADTIEGIDGNIDEKMLNVGKFIVELEHQAEGIKAIIDRQQARRKQVEARAEWLRSYLITAMEKTGKTKVAGPDIALSLAKMPTSVVIYEEDAIPMEFMDIKMIVTPNKSSIKTAGGCPGARVESTGYRVSIK